MFDVSVHNVYQIYRASAAQQARLLDHLGFRREVAKVYLGLDLLRFLFSPTLNQVNDLFRTSKYDSQHFQFSEGIDYHD